MKTCLLYTSKDLGLPTKEHLAVTGVKAYLNEKKKDNVSLALIGELDALRIPEHKYANPETQGAHCLSLIHIST